MIENLYEINERRLYLSHNQYIPCINWFKISINHSYIKISENERWQKSGFANRCVVAGGNGLINLSVPVENGRNQKALLKDIKIAYHENWQIGQWRTIVSCYNRSPFFEYYRDGFLAIFEKEHKFLFDLNLELIQLVISYLSINVDIIVVNDNNMPYLDRKENHLDPQNFQLGPTPVRYMQTFMDRYGFQANLSILDLLFMEGPEAATLLKVS